MTKYILGSCLVVFTLFFCGACENQELVVPSTLKFNAIQEPYSLDPIDFDHFAHHQTFRSVLSSIISQYKGGVFTPILAKEWNVSKNMRKWTFVIRENIFFENGDPITAQIIVGSWKRLAFLMLKRNSQSEFFRRVIGIDLLKKIDSVVPGLYAEGNKVHIELTESFPGILELLSFGMYSVAHPQDYDQLTGAWKNPKKAISSSFYKIQQWNSHDIILQLRSDFLSEVRHHKAFEKIMINWDQSQDNVDLIAGDSGYIAKENFRFFGPTPSGIGFLRIYSWKNPQSLFSRIEVRKCFRDAFYRSMEKSGAKISRSFFSPIMQGIHQINQENATCQNDIGRNQVIHFAFTHRKRSHDFILYEKSVVEALQQLGFSPRGVHLHTENVRLLSDENAYPHSCDIRMAFTSILVGNPYDDIRFMFQSKEGMRFPDPNGRANAELNKKDFSVQRINELLWEEAIIIPIAHYSIGLWAKDFIDLSQLSLLLPPIDFAFVGAKD